MKRFATAIILAAMPVAAFAQQPDRPAERVINVNATASVEREPDRAVIMLAVESNGATARAAAQANATRMDALVAALRRAGIPAAQIRTVSYDLQPQYSQPARGDERQPPRIVGYRALNMVQVTVDSVAIVGNVIDAAIGAGANRVAGLQFELRDPQSARREALRLAVERARADAVAIAEAAGERLGPALNITSTEWAVPKYGRVMAEMAMNQMDAPAAAPTPVEGGTLTVSAMVSATFRIESR